MNRFVIIAIAILILILIGMNLDNGDTTPPISNVKTPWNVTTNLATGSTSVFGITLGNTTASKVMRITRLEPEIVLFELAGNQTVEAYYGKFSMGGVRGSLVAVLTTPEGWNEEAIARAIKTKPASDGGLKHVLASVDYQQASLFTVKSLTYVPTIRLDKEIVNDRFGPPEETFVSADGRTHIAYRSMGVIVSLNPEGKTIISYMLPVDYESAKSRLIL